MARAYRRFQAGETIRIELKVGSLVSGIVTRAQDYDIAVKFEEPIDLAEVLSGAWAAEGTKPLRLPRLSMGCPAMMTQGASSSFINVTNISQRGLKLETSGAMAAPGAVLLTLPDLPPISGTIRWLDGTGAGVLFNNCLQFEVLARWVEARRRS